MEIKKNLKTDCIEICDFAENKDNVLKKIAALAKKNPLLNKISEETIYKSLLDREKLGSTAISNRIAIPHCRLKGIDDFVLGLLVVKNGVDYDAIDGKKTYVFIFIIAPENLQSEHVRLLSYVSQYLRKQENINKLLNAKDASSIRESLIRHTKIPQEFKTTDSHQLLTIIIQDENKFDDILNVLTEFEGSNIAVIEAANAGRFLYHMPLFSSFLRSERNDYCRIITAVVESAILQDLVGNINEIINDKSGIMFYVQPIKYTQGKLEI